MSQIQTPVWISKETSHHTDVRYQSQLVHEVNPIQRELVSALKSLKQTTNTFIDYKPIGKLGVILTGLDPVIRHIISTDKRGVIHDAARRELEQDINTMLPDFRGTQVQLDNPSRPLGLFGTNKQNLGIRLAVNDPILFGERVLAERFIKEEYPLASERFGDELLGWEPHISIGTIRPGGIWGEALEDLMDDPNSYIEESVQSAYSEMEERFGISVDSRELVFPESLTLGALKVVCDKQPDRIF